MDNQKQDVCNEIKGLSNIEILKLINDTFGTNYTSNNSWDIMETLRTEWGKLSE